MENRRMIRLSVLHNKIRGNDIDGDWVTIGIIVHKSEPRVSAKVCFFFSTMNKNQFHLA